MNIKDLVKNVARATDVKEADAKAFVMATFDQIAEAAANGEEVSISGFGKFSVKERGERQGRNPATGEAMTISASRRLAFAPAKAMKDRI